MESGKPSPHQSAGVDITFVKTFEKLTAQACTTAGMEERRATKNDEERRRATKDEFGGWRLQVAILDHRPKSSTIMHPENGGAVRASSGLELPPNGDQYVFPFTYFAGFPQAQETRWRPTISSDFTGSFLENMRPERHVRKETTFICQLLPVDVSGGKLPETSSFSFSKRRAMPDASPAHS
jgi:hypothetical protein